MALIDEIRAKLDRNEFEFSRHAVEQSIRRDVTVMEIRQAISVGEIIEDYPDDKFGPTCLLFGQSKSGRPLHVQCSYPSRDLVKIITLYEPDPARWIDFRKRKP